MGSFSAAKWSAVCSTFRPTPTTVPRRCSTRIPAIFLPLTSTSLGHLMATGPPMISSTTRATDTAIQEVKIAGRRHAGGGELGDVAFKPDSFPAHRHRLAQGQGGGGGLGDHGLDFQAGIPFDFQQGLAGRCEIAGFHEASECQCPN